MAEDVAPEVASGEPGPAAGGYPEGVAPAPQLTTPAEWPWAKVGAQTAPPQEATEASQHADAEGALASCQVAADCSASTDAEHGPLSFRQHLWERFEFLWDQRLEPSDKLLQQTMQLLRSRAELERKYAESLVGFGVEANLQSKQNSVHAAVESTIVAFRNRGEQSFKLADDIEQDIVVSFEAVLEQHQQVAKRIQADAQLLMKYVQERRRNHEKAARRYGSRCAEAEAVAQDCLQGLSLPTADRLKLGQQAVQLSQKARVAEYEYYSAIEHANRAQALYEQQMPHILETLQDMEEKRGQCLRDGLRKLAVYDLSWLRNMQYELDATAKIAEETDPNEEIQQFIRSFLNVPAEGPAFGQRHSAQAYIRLGKGSQARKMTPELQQQQQEAQKVRQLMDESQPLLTTLFENKELTDDPDFLPRLHELRINLVDQRLRSAFCQCLRNAVLQAEPQGPETALEASAGMSVNGEAFETLVACFGVCLDACDAQNDVWTGRDLMVLAQLFRMASDSGKPVSLLSRVYTHALWNKVTFWEEVLMLAICEAHCAEACWRRTLAAGSQFTQPCMTQFLQRFVGYMMAFGISFEQGRNSVIGTLKKQVQMLGPEGVNAYAQLLLSPYEVGKPQQQPHQQQEPVGIASPVSNILEQTAPVPGPLPAVSPAKAAPSADAEDDFEAIAMGFQGGPPADAAGETTPSQVGTEEGPSSVHESNDDPDRSEEDEAAGAESEALRVLADSQPKTDDVFG